LKGGAEYITDLDGKGKLAVVLTGAKRSERSTESSAKGFFFAKGVTRR